MIVLNLMLAAAVLGAGDPDGVISTAPAGHDAPLAVSAEAAAELDAAHIQIQPHGLTTQQQIDRWLTPAADATSEPLPSSGWNDDRRVHGEVSVAVGTGDYRAWSASVTAPIGDNGFVSLTYRESRGGPAYLSYGDYPTGYDLRDYGRWNAPRMPGPAGALAGPRRDPETGALMVPTLEPLGR